MPVAARLVGEAVEKLSRWVAINRHCKAHPPPHIPQERAARVRARSPAVVRRFTAPRVRRSPTRRARKVRPPRAVYALSAWRREIHAGRSARTAAASSPSATARIIFSIRLSSAASAVAGQAGRTAVTRAANPAAHPRMPAASSPVRRSPTTVLWAGASSIPVGRASQEDVRACALDSAPSRETLVPAGRGPEPGRRGRRRGRRQGPR